MFCARPTCNYHLPPSECAYARSNACNSLPPSSILFLQNGLGVVLAGALAGYVYLQKQDKLKVEEQLSSELSSERSTVDELKQKVSHLHLIACLGFFHLWLFNVDDYCLAPYQMALVNRAQKQPTRQAFRHFALSIAKLALLVGSTGRLPKCHPAFVLPSWPFGTQSIALQSHHPRPD